MSYNKKIYKKLDDRILDNRKLCTNKKREIGNLFEKICKNYLISSGYNILETNYYSRYGEIDIVASNKEYLVFVEVKARKQNSLTKACEAVTQNKKLKIIKTAYQYLAELAELAENDTKIFDLQLQPRFDVCEIYYSSNLNSLNYGSYLDDNFGDSKNFDENYFDKELNINYIENAFDLNSINLEYKI